MNLLFVSVLYPPVALGGYEQMCFDVTQALRGRGHQVSVLTSSSRAEEVRLPEAGVHRLLELRRNVSDSNGKGRWVRGTRFEVDVRNARTVERLIHSVDPDLVVVYKASDMGRALLSTAESLVPVVYRISDPWLIPWLSPSAGSRLTRLRRALYDRTLRLAGVHARPPRPNHAVFNSHALRHQYAAAGVDVRNASVIHPGISTTQFSMRPQHILSRAPSERHSVLYVGRICPAKGVATLVEAVGKINGTSGLQRPKLSLVGPVEDEHYENHLRRLAAELSVDVEFGGSRRRSALPEVYQDHDVLVFPSEWLEPFGLVLIEAMACGLPVITSLRGGPSEIVRDGETAIGFEAGRARDLADKIVWTLTHPARAAEIGRSASDDVTRRFALDRHVSSLEAYCGEIIRLATSLPRKPSPLKAGTSSETSTP